MSYVMVASEQPSKPAGVIESLGRGFETVASRAGLLLLPMVLDFFLWLGPQLSIEPLVIPVVDLLNAELPAQVTTDHSSQLLHTVLTDTAESLNMFVLLSTAPLGVPSLLVATTSRVSPVGPASVIAVSSYSGLLPVAIALNLIGLLLGAVYLGMIAQQVLPKHARWTESEITRGLWVNWIRLIGLVLTILAALILFSAPALILSSFLGLLHPTLTNLASSLVLAVGLWMLFFLAFSMHGIVLRGSRVKQAIIDSILLVRRNMPAAAGLLTLGLLINWGMGYLCAIPNPDSWLLILGVAGHAFIATGLVAANFIFYQDRYRWTNEMQEWIKKQQAGN